MAFELLKKIVDRLIGDKYIIILREREGIIKNGEFTPCDFSSQVLVNKDKNFILEKGKYKIALRDQKQLRQDEPVGMYVIDNTRESYNKFWGSEEIINCYLDKNRVLFFRKVISQCKKYIHGQTIDIGCGSGDFLRILNELGIDIKIHGIDFSGSAIQRCKKLLPNGNFAVGNIYKMGYADNTFDVVFCIEVLEHLESPDIAFREIGRICKKNGIIIITIPNGAYDGYIGHLNFWSESEFRDFIGNLKILDFKYLEDKRTMLFVINN